MTDILTLPDDISLERLKSEFDFHCNSLSLTLLITRKLCLIGLSRWSYSGYSELEGTANLERGGDR